MTVTKKKYKFKFTTIIIIICILGIIYNSYKLFTWKKDTKKNKEKKKKIQIIIEDDRINFDKLKSINPDTIAYIKVNNTNIDYVVVKANDNKYYLNHNFNNEKNIAGWIFGDYRNKFDETDKNLIIYGHNMKDGSMFETLIYAIDKNWYTNEENMIITLITEMNEYKYRIFSTYSIKAEDYYITTNFNDNTDFEKFINTLKERSIYDYGVDISGNDKILTLSSCIGDGKKRVVLHAKLIEE